MVWAVYNFRQSILKGRLDLYKLISVEISCGGTGSVVHQITYALTFSIQAQ